MKIEDKFNILFNELKLLKEKIIESENFEQMNNKIKDLDNKIGRKDEEIKNIINQKDNVIKEMNKKIVEQERKIKELNNEKRNIDFLNRNENDIKQIYNKNENIMKIISDKFSSFEKDFNDKFNQINEQINNINQMKEEIKNLNNKLNTQEKNQNDNHKIIDDILNNIEEMINTKIDNKINQINKDDIQIKIENIEKEDINDDINMKFNDKIILDNIIMDYEKKIKYEFTKDPKNLKFKCNITTTNTKNGWNDIFEIYTSFKDNKEYLVSPNVDNYNLDIFSLIDNQKKLSLKGHHGKIKTVRYFINNKNKKEYLISGADDKKVIIWDINNNYNIIFTIDTKYIKSIFSCLLIFPDNKEDTYIIISSYSKNENNENSATKVYSMNNKDLIKYIMYTNNVAIYYLLSWLNKTNNQLYIIQFCGKKIIINNLLEDELYAELNREPETDHLSGFIYSKDKNDFLYSSSSNGYVNVWDLYNKKIYKVINFFKCKLDHMIKWNKKFFIVAERENKIIIIINIENNTINKIYTKHSDELISIKKIYHPIFGESLLSSSRDKSIKLWIIE